MKQTTPEDHPAARRYEIRIKGHLDDRWTHWFEGLTLMRDANGETRLTGPVVDQAALHGLLRKVRDLGLPLVSVMEVDHHQTDVPIVKAETEHTRSEKRQTHEPPDQGA